MFGYNKIDLHLNPKNNIESLQATNKSIPITQQNTIVFISYT